MSCRSASCAAPPTSVAVLLSGLTSPPPATDAVLTIEGGAGSPIVTSMKIGGKLAPSSSAPARVQVTVRPLIEQLHPSPPGSANEANSAGIGSVTVTLLPSLGRLPTLETTSRSLDAPPATNSGVCSLVIDRSGAATTLVTASEPAVTGTRRLCVTNVAAAVLAISKRGGTAPIRTSK